MQPLITTLFVVLLLPTTIAPLFSDWSPMIICVAGTAVVRVTSVFTVSLGCGLTTTGAFGAGCGLQGHGQRLAGAFSVLSALSRAFSQSSKRSRTTSKESVNLRFSRNKLSTTKAVRSVSFVSLGFSESLQLDRIIAATAIGVTMRNKIHLFDGFCVIGLSFGYFVVFYI